MKITQGRFKMNERKHAVWLDPGDVFFLDDEPDEEYYYCSHQPDDKILVRDSLGNESLISIEEEVTIIRTY